MRVSIDIPDSSSPSASPSADSTALQQLIELQRQLVTLMKARPAMASAPADGLTEALSGLKRLIAGLPEDLQRVLDKQYEQFQQEAIKPSKVTMEMPTDLLTRLDALEVSLANGLKRSRNRTFGSNF